jgi:hypothetical protein
MTGTEHDSAEAVAAEMGPWRIARENGFPPRLSLPEIAERWAEEVEPEDFEAREAAEEGALQGFDRYLAAA